MISDEEDREALKWPGNMMTEQLYQYNTARRSACKLRFADSPVEWWITQRQRWPTLSGMALDGFSTPVVSDEPERVSVRLVQHSVHGEDR